MGSDKGTLRLSAQTLRVLAALLSSTRDELFGAEVGRQANVASGSLYPILARLERAGWLDSRWETEDPQALGRPRRRYYRVTAVGARAAAKAFRPFEPTIRKLALARPRSREIHRIVM